MGQAQRKERLCYGGATCGQCSSTHLQGNLGSQQGCTSEWSQPGTGDEVVASGSPQQRAFSQGPHWGAKEQWVSKGGGRQPASGPDLKLLLPVLGRWEGGAETYGQGPSPCFCFTPAFGVITSGTLLGWQAPLLGVTGLNREGGCGAKIQCHSAQEADSAVCLGACEYIRSEMYSTWKLSWC